MRAFELTNAVAVAYRPGIAEGWHAGERVFDAAVTTPELEPDPGLVPTEQLLVRARVKTANQKKRERRARR